MMPKATMNEDHFSLADKDQIWFAGQTPVMKAISVAHSVNEPPDKHLRSHALALDRTHICASIHQDCSKDERIAFS
jgi:hypothetical protein